MSCPSIFTENELFTYKNLFKSRSKPASHYKAIASLNDEIIRSNCPEPLKALVDAAKKMLMPPLQPPNVEADK